MQDLGSLGGGNSEGLYINSAGQVAGNSITGDGVYRAYIYDAAYGMKDIGTLGYTYSTAAAITRLPRGARWYWKTMSTVPSELTCVI